MGPAFERVGRNHPHPNLPPSRGKGEEGRGSGGFAVDLDAVSAAVEDHDAVFGVDLDGDGLAEFLFLLGHVGDAGALLPEGGVAAKLELPPSGQAGIAGP